MLLPLLTAATKLLLLQQFGLAATAASTDSPASGVGTLLARAAKRAPQGAPAVDPNAKYLFYDIIEHEQFNKQRKGMMYAYNLAKSLGRQLVLHRFRVRKYSKKQPQNNPHRPAYTYEYYPWRSFFDMRAIQGDVVVHEFDQLLHKLGGAGDGGDFKFAFEQVFFMNKLLEGDREVRIDDTPCKAGFQWAKQSADSRGRQWVGSLYDIAGLPAKSVRCVDIHGQLIRALQPVASAQSIVLLNAHFQLGYRYAKDDRKNRHFYWVVREHLLFKQSLWTAARRFVQRKFGAEEFLGVHWRRGDFVYLRQPDVVKRADEVAPRIQKLLQDHGLSRVFLATGPDTTPTDVEELRVALNLGAEGIVRYEADAPAGKKRKSKSGATLAVYDQMVCALSKVFIGTKTSLFSLTIMEERDILGKAFEATNLFFGD